MLNRSNKTVRQNYSSASVSGFTLIEVMVGVAIFAVLSALIVGSIQGNGDRNAKLEAQRFIAVLNEVRDEAVISGKILVMRMDEKARSYGFSVYGGNENSQSEADVLLRTRTLHKSVKLKWEVFEEFNDEDEDKFEEVLTDIESSTSVFVTPFGELTPFQVWFGGEDDVFIVQLNNEGMLEMDVKPSGFY